MDNGLKNKLTRFEETPPAGAWDKIVSALDTPETFAQKLYHYTATPPPNTWDTIILQLNKDQQPAKVIPFITRFKKPIRYVAAASIIGVILIAASLLMKRTEAGAIQPGSTATVPTQKTLTIKNGKEQITSNNKIKQPVPPEETTKLNLQSENNLSVKERTPHKRLLGFIKPQNISAFSLAGGFVPLVVNKKALFDFSSSDNFMVYSDGNGNAMKLSKKLFSLVHCQDEDGSCKERIHQLRQKLSSAAISADFTGILEMLRQLQ
ncbi:MAG: hypothetical protein M3Y85_06470 [Bacteroidota bacterium]|nr:hypothetical protein [Bacteroidota bacterium]